MTVDNVTEEYVSCLVFGCCMYIPSALCHTAFKLRNIAYNRQYSKHKWYSHKYVLQPQILFTFCKHSTGVCFVVRELGKLLTC